MAITGNYFCELSAQGLGQREIARLTGIPRTSLQRRLKRLGIIPTPPTERAPASNVPPAPPMPPAPQAPRVPPALTFVAASELQEVESVRCVPRAFTHPRALQAAGKVSRNRWGIVKLTAERKNPFHSAVTSSGFEALTSR